MKCMWEKKGAFTSNGRFFFLLLAVKLMPMLLTPDRRVSLCMHLEMVLVCSCKPRHTGVVEGSNGRHICPSSSNGKNNPVLKVFLFWL